MVDLDNLKYNGRDVKLLHQAFEIVIIMDKETKKQYCVPCKDVGLPNRKRPTVNKDSFGNSYYQ